MGSRSGAQRRRGGIDASGIRRLYGVPHECAAKKDPARVHESVEDRPIGNRCKNAGYVNVAIRFENRDFAVSRSS